MTAEAVHASCVVVGEAAVLIRGASGSGKSTLARSLVAFARHKGLFSALVGDDRVLLEPTDGRLVARPHRTLAGTIEIRGFGLVDVPHAPSAVVRLVVDCDAAPERLPDAGEQACIHGVCLPRLAGRPDPETILMALDGRRSTLESEPPSP